MQHSTTSIKLKAATLEKIDEDYFFVVEVASRNISKISKNISGEVLHRYLTEWENALSNKDVLKSIVSDNTELGFDMWQINPFTGIFTPKERWDILRRECS